MCSERWIWNPWVSFQAMVIWLLSFRLNSPGSYYSIVLCVASVQIPHHNFLWTWTVACSVACSTFVHGERHSCQDCFKKGRKQEVSSVRRRKQKKKDFAVWNSFTLVCLCSVHSESSFYGSFVCLQSAIPWGTPSSDTPCTVRTLELEFSAKELR